MIAASSERSIMFGFDVYVAAAIFFSSFFLDLIAARYTYYVVSLHAERAAALSFLWHMVSAIVVIQYAQNAFYIVFVGLGGALGTFFTVWAKRRLGNVGWLAPKHIEEAILPPVATPSVTKPLPAELLVGLVLVTEQRHQAAVA